MNVASSAPVTIRPASREDVPLVLSFIRELAKYEKLEHEVTATEDLLRGSLFGTHKVADAVIAYAGDVPAGFAVFFQNFSTFAGRPVLYMEDLFVNPQYRGLGIGKALLCHLEGLARERGCDQLQWAVLKWNQPAIDFYEGRGAVAMQDWTIYRLTLE